MRIILLASILALAAPALAAPTPTPTPTAPAKRVAPSNGCLVEQIVTSQVFQLEHVALDPKRTPESKLQIVSNGGWIYTESLGGKVTRTEAGCLTRAELTTISASLVPATWKLVDEGCEAQTTGYVRYVVKGKKVMEVRCGKRPDKATATALAAVEAITKQLL